MRTLNISISDLEYKKFGLKKDKLAFSDFVDLISKELSKQNLSQSLEMAEKYGLSRMSMADVTKEVKAVRKHAKNNH